MARWPPVEGWDMLSSKILVTEVNVLVAVHV